MATLLMPLPDSDFDPTESGVPWRTMRDHGHFRGDGQRDRQARSEARAPRRARTGLIDPASRRGIARLDWQQVGGGRDDAKLTVRYRDHAPLVRDAG
jgi:hypothetical protein